MQDPAGFRKFIQGELRFANISEEWCEKFTDSESMQLFENAFTSETVDPINNWEELEFAGDGIVKGILSTYIPEKYDNHPHICAYMESKKKKLEREKKKAQREFTPTSIQTKPTKLTREGIFHDIRVLLESKKTLSKLANSRGYWDWAQVDELTRKGGKKTSLEDIFEAFIGALTIVIDTKIKKGVGYNFARNYFLKVLERLNIDITKEELKDPVTVIGELYKGREESIRGGKQLNWGEPVYNTFRLQVPIISGTQFPSDPKPQLGDVFFSDTKSVAYIWDGRRWIAGPNLNRPMNLGIYPFTLQYGTKTDKDGRPVPDNVAYISVNVVYGYPPNTAVDRRRGKVSKQTIILEQPQRLFQNLEKPTPNAEVYGVGIDTDQKKSKKLAARQALKRLKNLGYELYWPPVKS